MAIKKRGGPQPKYARGRDGRVIVGLSLHKPSGRYYATHSKPRKYFGRDFDEAVAHFRMWEGGTETKFIVPVKKPAHDSSVKVRFSIPKYDIKLPEAPLPDAAVGPVVEHQAFSMVDEDGLYEWARVAIQTDKAKFADRTGIAAIAWLDNVAPPTPSQSLKEIGKLYFDKRSKLTKHWRRKQSKFWDQFVQLVGNRSVRDITAEHINKYQNAVWDEREREGRSPTFVSHRFQAVRTILRYALKNSDDATNVRRVLDLTERFEHPKKKATDPRPINAADFRKLLDASDSKWKAVFLISLNAALYPSEVAALKKDHVDLAAGTLRMRRGKTGIARVACLWPRTVAAVREHQRKSPHKNEYLFVNMNGSPYNANHISRNFRRRRSDAKLADSVAFEHIRDAAITTAAEAGCELPAVQALAGHRTPGITDAYLMRRPDLVRRACESIEAAYFDDADQIDGA